MNSNVKLSYAFQEIEKQFPFKNYISKASLVEIEAVVKELEKYLPKFENSRLLDIGCGPMDKTGIFSELGFDCYAVDDLNDPWHVIENNQENIKKFAKNVGINFHQQSIGDYNIPFEEESFDVVTSLAVIEHLHESPIGLLNTMGTFAKPGGLIVVVMPNSVNLRKRLSVLMGRTNFPPIEMFFNSTGNWRGHVREYTLKETEFICRETGFEVLSSSTFEHLAFQKLQPPLRNIYIALGKLFPTFASGLLVVSRKPENWKPAIQNSKNSKLPYTLN